MRILICSLQVSQGASKGHLHPAIETGLELRQRGHSVAILPIPSPLSQADRDQIQRCHFEIIEPPPLPKGLPLSPEELGQLAKNPQTTAEAYHSFLVAPLLYQFESILQKIRDYKPDIIVYDLLVYAAPLAARLLGIPDIGYCAGLKVIAPLALTGIYQSIRQKLSPILDSFLEKYSLTAKFHHLELLSSTYQLVFIPESFIEEKETTNPPNTIFAGSLPISSARCEEQKEYFDYNKRKNIVLCFGSVLDPANYPKITNTIINMANKFNCNLIISSRNPDYFPISKHIKIADYLPLPQLLQEAAIFIHHGGANTFSEALTIGVPQILIPLTTDQPIQAEYLRRSEVGISIYPQDVTEENIDAAFHRFLDPEDPFHHRIKQVKKIFHESKGAFIAGNLIEQVAKHRVNL
jgi:MGT family glycosyltransferase